MEKMSLGSCVLTWFWGLMITSFVLLGLLHKIYQYLPNFLKDMVVYGKLLDKRSRSFFEEYLHVPKRWFLHFYVISFICNGSVLICVLRYTFYSKPFPDWYVRVLEVLTCYPVVPASVDQLTVIIAMTVIVVQAARRVYECLFVSVYSNSNIHLSHYVIGVLFYSLASISLLSEGPNLQEPDVSQHFSQLLGDLKWHHILGVLMFLWASLHHHTAHVIFANLRQGKKDTNQHMIPRGDWFEYVSCPHYFAEILIYASLTIILGGRHTMWWFVLGFVMSNQFVAAKEVDRWYRRKFEDYPKNRKALIPWII